MQLDDAALERLATALSDLYVLRYEERPVDPRVSFADDMLAFVFEGGLTVADDLLLRSGKAEQLQEFRRHFFEVVDDELIDIVDTFAGVSVIYSFYGFDPDARRTHAIFVVDTSEPRGTWSGSDDRPSRRLPPPEAAESQRVGLSAGRPVASIFAEAPSGVRTRVG